MTGDVVTGGGFFGVKATSAVESSNPQSQNTNGVWVPVAWSVTVRSADTDGFTAYAICADMTP
jgi:hypothetical protein